MRARTDTHARSVRASCSLRRTWRTGPHARSVRASCSLRRTWRTGPPRPHRSAASLRTSLPHVPPAVGNVDWQREPPATTGTLRHCRCSRQHVKALTSSRRPRHARANQSATTTTGKAHLAVRVAHSARRLEHDEVGEARPAVGVHEEAAGGVYEQRPVLLQHAQDRRRPGAAIQPQHHGRALGHAALGRRVPVVVASSSAAKGDVARTARMQARKLARGCRESRTGSVWPTCCCVDAARRER